MGIADLISSLFSPAAKMIPAPALENYPSSQDAARAVAYGFGQGDPRMDGYVQGNAARVLGVSTPATGKRPATFIPRSGAGSYLDELTSAATNDASSKNVAPAPEGLSDVFARAALTANRIPIAALGFDPSRMVADTQTKNPTVAGAYSPSDDSIYFNMPEGRVPSTPVHESIHRGLEMLRKDPANADAFRGSPGNEESIVRYLMATQAGNPEQGSGDIADKQRATAVSIYENSGRSKDALDRLTRAAEEAIKNRRPGGPR